MLGAVGRRFPWLVGSSSKSKIIFLAYKNRAQSKINSSTIYALLRTNPVEALHRIIRKITKSKGAWISERALIKQLYLSLESSEKSWRRNAYHWKAIQADLEDKFGDRFAKWLEK